MGDWLFCSLLGPTNGEPGKNAEEDAVLLFKRVKDVLDTAGTTPDSIVHMGFYVLDDVDREAINKEWQKMFPDPQDRPARYILNVYPDGTHWRFACHFTAIVAPPDQAQLGKLTFSPLVTGQDASGKVSSDRYEEVDAMFANIKSWIESKGGTLDNLASMMVYLTHDERDILNKGWAKVFPDTSNLPCRQTLIMQEPPGLLNANFGAHVTAVL